MVSRRKKVAELFERFIGLAVSYREGTSTPSQVERYEKARDDLLRELDLSKEQYKVIKAALWILDDQYEVYDAEDHEMLALMIPAGDVRKLRETLIELGYSTDRPPPSWRSKPKRTSPKSSKPGSKKTTGKSTAK